MNITPIRLMEYTIITSENFIPVRWPGGTTTELFIYPLTAAYQQRNFQFRLSTATVETERSDFTSLPGISRKLVILSGQITISHEGHYSRQLNKFDADEFDGDWKTSSVGKCTDFNLMISGKTSGELASVVIKDKQSVNYTIKEKCEWLFLYMYTGEISIHPGNKISTLHKGDLLVLNNPAIKELEIQGIENSELVFIEIKKG
jgi:environmental stress-induced protein Ves